MNRFTIITVALFVFLGACGDILWNISQDIHAIRNTLAPFPISVEQPEMRQRVLLREDSHQEPEVTLL